MTTRILIENHRGGSARDSQVASPRSTAQAGSALQSAGGGPPSYPLIYVVVLTYNGKRFLEPCFRTLLGTVYPNVRWLLVDNASQENLADYVHELFPAVETLRLEKNLGYAGGANAGIEHAHQRGAVYVAICNDDIEIVSPRWLDHSMHHMESDRRIGIVGYKEYRPQEAIPVTDDVRLRETRYPIGFVLLYRASLLRNIGLYDRAYGTGSDDDDMVWRALKAGYSVGEFNIPFIHHGGGTYARHNARTGYLHMRNSLRFFIKHRWPLYWLLRTARIVDVACNPWPISFKPDDLGHQRWRNQGNVLLNAFFLARALVWNTVRLPQTLWIRVREARLNRRTRKRLEQELGAPRKVVVRPGPHQEHPTGNKPR